MTPASCGIWRTDVPGGGIIASSHADITLFWIQLEPELLKTAGHTHAPTFIGASPEVVLVPGILIIVILPCFE